MSITKKLDDDLLKQLECPVCLEYMLSKITLCENGHNICTNCRSSVSTCSSCGGSFLQVRNKALEDIARTAMYPCKNREGGCNEIFCLDEKIGHESKCLYEKRICPFTKLSGVKCPWVGVLSDVAEHVRRDHGCTTQNSMGIFLVSLETLCASKQYIQAVFTLGKLFFIVWEVKESNIYFAVFHAGLNNGDEKFTYKFSVKRHDDEKISMRAICHSYLQETSEVLQPGECIVLHYGTVLKYFSKSCDLSCVIKIRKSSDNYVLRAVTKWFEDQSSPPLQTAQPPPQPVEKAAP